MKSKLFFIATFLFIFVGIEKATSSGDGGRQFRTTPDGAYVYMLCPSGRGYVRHSTSRAPIVIPGADSQETNPIIRGVVDPFLDGFNPADNAERANALDEELRSVQRINQNNAAAAQSQITDRNNALWNTQNQLDARGREASTQNTSGRFTSHIAESESLPAQEVAQQPPTRPVLPQAISDTRPVVESERQVQIQTQVQELRNVVNSLLSQYEYELRTCSVWRHSYGQLAHAEATMTYKRVLLAGFDVGELIPKVAKIMNTSIAELPAKFIMSDDFLIKTAAMILSSEASDAVYKQSENEIIAHVLTTTIRRELESLLEAEMRNAQIDYELLAFLNNFDEKHWFDKLYKHTSTAFSQTQIPILEQAGKVMLPVRAVYNMTVNFSQAFAHHSMSREYQEKYSYYTDCEVRKSREVAFLRNVKEKFDDDNADVVIVRASELLRGRPFYGLNYDGFYHDDVLDLLQERINSNRNIDIARIKNSAVPVPSPAPIGDVAHPVERRSSRTGINIDNLDDQMEVHIKFAY